VAEDDRSFRTTGRGTRTTGLDALAAPPLGTTTTTGPSPVVFAWATDGDPAAAAWSSATTIPAVVQMPSSAAAILDRRAGWRRRAAGVRWL